MTHNSTFSKMTSKAKYSFDEWEGKQKSDKRNKPKRDRKSKRDY